MDAKALREIFEAVLPDDAIDAVVQASGMQRRERKLDARRWVRSAILASGSSPGRRQAAIVGMYLGLGAETVARGAAYSWFNEPFEQAMAAIATRTLGYARLQPLDLPGWIGEPVRDWHAYDSMTVKLDDALKVDFPGAGDYAALKVHKRFSLGLGTTVDYHISPAREHDSQHLTLDETWRGLGLLADLGYASKQLIRDAAQFGVTYVIRLKDSWKPRVLSIQAGEVTRTFMPGAGLEAMLDAEVLVLNGQSVDATVRVGHGSGAVQARLVGVCHEGKYRFYLTNLATNITPDQVATLYRVRWEIELDNKLNKSNFHIEEIAARTPGVVRALVHASITASVLVCLIAHQHRLAQKPPPEQGTERTKPPIHVHGLALDIACASELIAGAFELEGTEATKMWQRIVGVLSFRGFDSNWRRRPSVIDQLRGWVVRPARPRRAAREENSADNTN